MNWDILLGALIMLIGLMLGYGMAASSYNTILKEKK